MPKEKSYSYYEYKLEFSDDCLTCDGTGQAADTLLAHLEQQPIGCPDCKGTGKRRDVAKTAALEQREG